MILKAINNRKFLKGLDFVYQIELVRSTSVNRLIRLYCVDSFNRRVNIILKPIISNQKDIDIIFSLNPEKLLNYVSKRYLNSYLFFDTEVWNAKTKRINQTLYDKFYLNNYYSSDSFFIIRAVEVSDRMRNKDKRLCLIKTVDKFTEAEILEVITSNTVYTTLSTLIINAI